MGVLLWDAWNIEEESSTSLRRMVFDMFDRLEEESSTSFTGDIIWDAWNIKEESFASLLRMMFLRFDPAREWLLCLSHWGWFLMHLIH